MDEAVKPPALARAALRGGGGEAFELYERTVEMLLESPDAEPPDAHESCEPRPGAASGPFSVTTPLEELVLAVLPIRWLPSGAPRCSASCRSSFDAVDERGCSERPSTVAVCRLELRCVDVACAGLCGVLLLRREMLCW